MIRNITILLLLSLSYSATLLVPNEYSTIQSAIDVSSNGDEVLVSAGTYYETINFNGKNISVIGADKETTIIDGDVNDDGVGDGSVVIFGSEEPATSVLSGFTITNGYAENGGGIAIYSSSHPTLTHLTISDNKTIGSGGGVWIFNGSHPTLDYVMISDNEATGNGGGIYFSISGSSLTNVTITDNAASSDGGGIYGESVLPGTTFQNVIISNNSATGDGGGIYGSYADWDLVNVDISDNTSGGNGGGIYSSGSSINIDGGNISFNTANGSSTYGGGGGIFLNDNNLSYISNLIIANNYSTYTAGGISFVTNGAGDTWLTNVTIAFNTAGNYRGGINGFDEGSTLILTNCIYWDNAPLDDSNFFSASYSNIEGGYVGDGNIDAEPLFTDIENGDYTLQSGSPCIDEGIADTDDDGIDDITDYFGSAPDMGAYEYEIITGCTDPDGCNYNPDANVDDENCEYPDACGICDLDSSNDNACFTYPNEIIGNWGGEGALHEYNNPDCGADLLEELKQNQITFKDDGTLSHLRLDRLNGQYPCDQNPGCNINVDGEELMGTCSEDGFCQIQVAEEGSWGVNNNELCLLMGENEDPTGSKEYVCGEYIFSDDEESFTLTLILNTTECFIINFNTRKYTISINGTTEIFDHTCFIVDWQADELIIETNYIEVVNDTVFQVAYQEPNYSPVETNTIITPIFPSVGSAWQGMFGGPANFEVQKLTNIVVLADTALAYIYQIHEEDSGEHRGSMTFSADIGMLSMMQIFGSDTFSIILESYTIVGGNGVFPLAIGNEWTFVDGNYYDIQIQGCTEEGACNYDKHADINDGSCEYMAEGACDCDGNVEDCDGVCGGDANEDECLVCDTNPSNNNECLIPNDEMEGEWALNLYAYDNGDCEGDPQPVYGQGGFMNLVADGSYEIMLYVQPGFEPCTSNEFCQETADSEDHLGDWTCNNETGNCELRSDFCSVFDYINTVTNCSNRWGYNEDMNKFCWMVDYTYLNQIETNYANCNVPFSVHDNGSLSSISFISDDDGTSCLLAEMEAAVMGCTAPEAQNYDEDANINDGSCENYYGGNKCFISKNGNDESGYGSELNPYATIQRGIDMVSAGDTLIIEAGTYVENINITGKDITLGSQYLIDSDTTYIHQTVIDGNQNGSVVFHSNCNVTIAGLTIQNGNSITTPTNMGLGGGIFSNGESGILNLTHCVIRNNSCQLEGGGIYSSIVSNLNNCVIEGNSSGEDGGGIKINGPEAFLNAENCQINNNSAIGAGGCGIADNAQANFTNCSIYGNTTGGIYEDEYIGGGGGIGTWNANITLTGCEIYNNFGYWDGGGISIDTTIATITNCNIHHNTTNGGGGGISCLNYSTLNVNASHIDSNSATWGGGCRIADNAEANFVEGSINGNTAQGEIEGGEINGSGGGIVIYNATANFSDLDISNNLVKYDGGGILLAGGSQASFNNVTISENTSIDGGGGGIASYHQSSFLLVENSTIRQNSANWGGGGLACMENSIAHISDVTIIGNSTEGRGGGIQCYDSDLHLTDVTIQENEALYAGGGLEGAHSNMQITESNFLYNSVFNDEYNSFGGGLSYFNYNSTDNDSFQVNIGNSNFKYNSASTADDNRYTMGGGISIGQYNDNSIINVNISDCSIEYNSAESYGGIRIMGENIDFVLDSTKVMYNEALYYASAGGFDNGSSGLVNRSIIANNIISEDINTEASALGVIDGSNVNFINTTFFNNITFNGGALSILNEGVSTVKNCIFWKNTPYQIVLDSKDDAGGNMIVLYNDIEGGIASIIITDSLSVLDYGIGNINANPLFCDVQNEDFTLAENSPCIENGSDNDNIGALDVGCGVIATGCIDVNACNYNPDVSVDDGSCIYVFDLCGVCGGDNSSCAVGCTDYLALNCQYHADIFDDCITCPNIPCAGFYDPDAEYNDGSCIYPTYGCRDSDALNYDPDATNSDGGCEYPHIIGLSIGNIDLSAGTIEIILNSPVEVASLQFSLPNVTLTGASGGSAEEAGFSLSVSENTVNSGFGDNIPAGSGILTILTFTGTSDLFCVADFSVDVDPADVRLGGCASVVGTTGGIIESELVSVEIPEGALLQPETIAVGEVTADLPESISNATGFEVSQIVAFTPYNHIFYEPVEISLPSDGLSRMQGDTYFCYNLDSNDETWKSYAADCTGGQCKVQVSQTGNYTLCVLQNDCNEELGGDAFIDDCGECVGGGTGRESGYTKDECRLCYGPGYINWWKDSDGDGLGHAPQLKSCGNVVPSGYVANDNDEDDNCFSNFHDACGICDGDGALCQEDCTEQSTFYRDADGDGFGDDSGIEENFCLSDGEGIAGWVTNSNDFDDNCQCAENDKDNCYDACQICDGPGYVAWWHDEDGDGYGAGLPDSLCVSPLEDDDYVRNNSDLWPECDSNNIDFCGECDGENICIPRLVSTSLPGNGEILSLKQEPVTMQFSVPLLPVSKNAVEFTSALSDNELDTDIDFIDDLRTKTQITFNQLTSGDTIDLHIYSAVIVADTNTEYNMSKVYNDLMETYYIEYLGDYNHDWKIDEADIDTLTKHWGVDNKYELGPCAGGQPCKPENVPHLTPAFDEKWDIEDLIAFILMYKYSAASARLADAGSIKEKGKAPALQFDSNILKIVLPEYNLPVHHVWIQLDISGSEVSFHPAEFSSQFDMVLNRDFPEENAGQWSLINLDGIDSKKEFFFGSFQGRSQKGKAMEIQYKLTSRGHVLSSGTMNLEYTPVPDQFDLSQAYPNPFNPRTTIEYALPVDSEMMLSVYDLHGRLLTYLAQGPQLAGYHKAIWDGSQYASGLYFIRMTIYDEDHHNIHFNKLRKVMLIK